MQLKPSFVEVDPARRLAAVARPPRLYIAGTDSAADAAAPAMR